MLACAGWPLAARGSSGECPRVSSDSAIAPRPEARTLLGAAGGGNGGGKDGRQRALRRPRDSPSAAAGGRRRGEREGGGTLASGARLRDQQALTRAKRRGRPTTKQAPVAAMLFAQARQVDRARPRATPQTALPASPSGGLTTYRDGGGGGRTAGKREMRGAREKRAAVRVGGSTANPRSTRHSAIFVGQAFAPAARRLRRHSNRAEEARMRGRGLAALGRLVAPSLGSGSRGPGPSAAQGPRPSVGQAPRRPRGRAARS